MTRTRSTISLLLFTAMAVSSITPLSAHQGEDHGDGVEIQGADALADQPFPIEFGGPFELTDHHGKRVSDRDFQGKHLLVFFGYVNCKIMCSTSLRRIAAALDQLGDRAAELLPVVITVDPKRDTPAVMKAGLGKLHPRLLGLTGSSAELAKAYQAYKISPKFIGLDPDGEPIMSHSSYLYLMSPQGDFQTLLPPIVKPEIMSQIIRKYLDS